MQVGSIVESQSNFDDVRNVWTDYDYPVMKQVLTVKTMTKHPRWGINKNTYKFYLLTFEEMETYPLCDKHFLELQPPMDLSELMKETESIKHTKREPNASKENIYCSN